MNLTKRKLTDLKVYENNPRSNTNAVSKVKESIERYGYKVPIVIDSDNTIVAGHTRFSALLQINEESGRYSEIDVVIADDLTENQVRQFRIVDNQVASIAEWDFLKLKLELDDLDDFILDDFGIIEGFDIELPIHEEDTDRDSRAKIKIGSETIEMTELDFLEWQHWVVSNSGLDVVNYVRQQLHLNREDR